VFIFLFLLSTRILVSVASLHTPGLPLTYRRKRGLKATATRVWLATTVSTFLLTTIFWIGITSSNCIQIKGYLVYSTRVVNNAALSQTNQKLAPLIILELWIPQSLVCLPRTSSSTDWKTQFSLQSIISDCMVLWRTWVLHSEQRWIMLAPCALLVGTIGIPPSLYWYVP